MYNVVLVGEATVITNNAVWLPVAWYTAQQRPAAQHSGAAATDHRPPLAVCHYVAFVLPVSRPAQWDE